MKSIKILILFLITIQIQAGNALDSLQINSIENPCFQLELFRLDCDACGCAAGNGSSGFETMLNPQFIGIRYFAQHYKAKENAFVSKANRDQYFNTLQLWARIPVAKKIEIYVGLPYHFHNRETSIGKENIDGIGDATLMGIYNFLDLSTKSMNNHIFNAGAGVKIPTAKFDEINASGTNPSFQLGTGSWDFLMALNYRFQMKKSAFTVSFDYTFKGENEKKYQFGDQFNYSGVYNYLFVNKSEFIFSGKGGFQGEIYQDNKQFGEVLNRTSGDALYGKIGFELAYKKWSLGSELMLPVSSNLASDDIEARSRVGVFLNYGL